MRTSRNGHVRPMLPTRPDRWLVALAALAVLAAGCGGQDRVGADTGPSPSPSAEAVADGASRPQPTDGSPPTATPATTPAPTPPAVPPPPVGTTARETALIDYFGPLATRAPAAVATAEDAAAPGSPAALFARLQVALARADEAAGRTAPLALQLEDGGVALCPVPADDAECTRITGIALLDGRVSGFDAGAGPIASRVAMPPDAPVIADDPRIAVEVLGALQTAAGPLLVAVDVVNGSDEVQRVFATEQAYAIPDGAQVGAEGFGSVADADIAPGERALAVLRFPEAPVGGTLVMTGRGADSFARWSALVPLPAVTG